MTEYVVITFYSEAEHGVEFYSSLKVAKEAVKERKTQGYQMILARVLADFMRQDYQRRKREHNA